MTTPAPPWVIAATTDRVRLDPAGQAETTFTVNNNGPVDQRLVLDVVCSENAGQVRFDVAEPQRLVPHGGSVSFLVRVTARPGTPAGSHWLAGRVYSADGVPEETSVLSDRVAFEVKPIAPPPPWWRRWWWLILVAALLVIGLVVVLVVALGGEDEPPSARCTAAVLTGVIQVDDSAAGNRYGRLLVTNTGSAPCSLNGYGELQLIDDNGQALPTRTLRDEPPEPSLIQLAPGAIAAKSLHWGVVPTGLEPADQPCQPEPRSAWIRPPDETEPFTVDWSHGPVCAAGTFHDSAYYTP